MSLVPGAGLEPARLLERGILSPLCLPISPPGHEQSVFDNTGRTGRILCWITGVRHVFFIKKLKKRINRLIFQQKQPYLAAIAAKTSNLKSAVDKKYLDI